MMPNLAGIKKLGSFYELNPQVLSFYISSSVKVGAESAPADT